MRFEIAKVELDFVHSQRVYQSRFQHRSLPLQIKTRTSVRARSNFLTQNKGRKFLSSYAYRADRFGVGKARKNNFSFLG